ELPIRAGFLEMTDALGFEPASDLDRAGGREAGIAVDELGHPVPERAGDRRDDLFGPTRPFVDVVAAFGTHTPFESVEPVVIAEPAEPGRLVHGRDVTLHRGGIGAQAPRPAAEEFHDRLARAPPGHVPERGVEPGERPAAVGPGELVLLLLHPPAEAGHPFRP